MSDTSETRLQAALHEHGFYTQRSPSSGTGIEDPQTGDRIDQADIVAVRAVTTTIPGSQPPPNDTREKQESDVLVIEDKHEPPPQVYIDDGERQALERIEEITGGTALIAVKWKYREGGHVFYRPEHLQDTGKHWKIEHEQEENVGELIDAI